MANVAFLGLGVMGFPMAGWLAKKGHTRHGVQPHGREGRALVHAAPRQGGRDAGRGGAGRRDRVQLRRRRSRPARDRARLGRRRSRRCAPAPSTSITRRLRPTSRARSRRRAEARRSLPRRAGVGRPSRRRERQAHGHGRRRGRAVRDGRARDPLVRAGRAADRARRARDSSRRWSTRSRSRASCRGSPRR